MCSTLVGVGHGPSQCRAYLASGFPVPPSETRDAIAIAISRGRCGCAGRPVRHGSRPTISSCPGDAMQEDVGCHLVRDLARSAQTDKWELTKWQGWRDGGDHGCGKYMLCVTQLHLNIDLTPSFISKHCQTTQSPTSSLSSTTNASVAGRQTPILVKRKTAPPIPWSSAPIGYVG